MLPCTLSGGRWHENDGDPGVVGDLVGGTTEQVVGGAVTLGADDE